LEDSATGPMTISFVLVKLKVMSLILDQFSTCWKKNFWRWTIIFTVKFDRNSEGLIYDAERDLLAIAKFFAIFRATVFFRTFIAQRDLGNTYRFHAH